MTTSKLASTHNTTTTLSPDQPLIQYIPKIQPIHDIPGVGADPDDDNDTIPISFVEGCQRDMVEARRRWQLTKRWRKENNVDSILSEPQPHYELIKKYYPHAVHRCTKDGRWLYIERPGHGKLDKLFAAGITLHDMERHYAFITEYLWRVIDWRDGAQIITIFDVDKCSLADLTGDGLKMFKKCTALVSAHYPERTSRIYVINSPWYASTGWSLVSPFLDPRTSAKVSMLRGSCKKALAHEIDLSELPTVLGGTDVYKFGESPVEQDMLALVRKLNGISL